MRRNSYYLSTVTKVVNGKPTKTRVLKPRDSSKYTPRPVNGTPRRLHSDAFRRGFR